MVYYFQGVLFINARDQPLDRGHFVRCMKKALISAGVYHGQYNSHSLRIGRTTDLALAGGAYDRIQLIGLWSSDAYLKYVPPSSLVLSWLSCIGFERSCTFGAVALSVLLLHQYLVGSGKFKIILNIFLKLDKLKCMFTWEELESELFIFRSIFSA